MRCAISIFPQNQTDWDRFEASERHEEVPRDPLMADSSIYRDYVRIARQVEELGFDGLWTVEHHFTPYTMVTNPLQFLTYFAACTEKVDLGTMVIVLPWHHPIRVAEDIAMLSQLMGDRRLVLGLGRGAGRREFSGFGVPMSESRSRFLEAVEIIRRALVGGRFRFEGEHFTIPETEIRPRCKDPERILAEMRMAWGSPSSVPIGASLGLKPMIVPQKPFEEYGPELAQFNRVSREAGFEPAGPIVCVWTYCAETEERAREGALRYMVEYSRSSTRHYEVSGSHFEGVAGYEHYAKRAAELRAQTGSLEELFSLRGENRINNNVWGTPDQCVAKISRIVALTGAREVILVPMFATMTYEVANASMHLFAKEALPAIHGLPPGPLVDESLAVASA